MNQKLIDWSHQEFSHLPWRNNRSLYTTLVSEIMLQQTTVSTVLNHFDRFIKEYPNVQALAFATEEELLISWKGLGYYRRARNLKKACETIVEKYHGEIPLDFNELIKIPGIGDYTANALLSIGANLKAIALDANLERVLARVYGIDEFKGPKLLKKIQAEFMNGHIASEIEYLGARNLNEALMDLGRVFCQARQTNCHFCPLNLNCVAYKTNQVLQIPKVLEVKKESFELRLLRILVKKDDKFLVYKKKDNEWLHGQFEVPTFILETNDEKLKQYPKMTGDFSMLPEFKTAITKYKITNCVLWADVSDLKKMNIDISQYEWGNKNLSTASMKAIKL